MIEFLKTSRSIRIYENREVEEEKVKEILKIKYKYKVKIQ